MTCVRSVLITGASSGIGEATARIFFQQGVSVYAAARRVERMESLKALGVHVLPLDITDEASILECIKKVIAREGHIDVLVNNAGYGSYGAVEDVSLDEARRQFEVNLFGLARLTQLVLPNMRENGFGKIVNITSVGGKIYTPFGAWYHATKHALEGWSDALRLELSPFGIDVIIIEPGGIKTHWGSIAVDRLRNTSGSGAYFSAAQKAADGMARLYEGDQLTDPSIVAQTIAKSVNAARPKTRYSVGYMAAVVLAMRRFLSDRMFDRIIASMV